jgi:hypothetical protein
MSYFFHQLAGGYSVAPYLGVECTVRVFPWTETFVENDKVVHYFEYDDPADDAFIKARIEAWTAFFEKRK